MYTVEKYDAIYGLIETEDQLKTIIPPIEDIKFIGIDTETTGLDWKTDTLLGICLSFSPNTGFYIPTNNYNINDTNLFSFAFDSFLDLDILRKYLNPIFQHKKINKYLHNAKFDMHFLDKIDMPLKYNIKDTMLLAWILFNKQFEKYGLKPLSKKLLGYDLVDFMDVLGNKTNFSDVNLEEATGYAGPDPDFTLRLAFYMEKLLDAKSKNVWDLENNVNHILMDMEQHGIFLHRNNIFSHYKELKEEELKLKDKLQKVYPINWLSPSQVGDYLFNIEKLPLNGIKIGANGKPKVDAPTLKILEDEHFAIPDLLGLRNISKQLYTYVFPNKEVLETGYNKVHPSFSSIRGGDAGSGITTGRLSSENPNGQNQPAKLRNQYKPEKGFSFVGIDYSQQEVRLLAVLGKDEGLLRGFNQSQVDSHLEVAYLLNQDKFKSAQELYNIYYIDGNVADGENETHPRYKEIKALRSVAKTFNFGIPYGLSKWGFANRLGCSPEEAEALIAFYFEAMPGVKNYVDSTKEFVLTNGYVETIFGRRRYFDVQDHWNIYEEPFDDFEKRKYHAILREAVNMPIQGSAADMIKLSMVETYKILFNMKSHLSLQVHDEIVFSIHNSELNIIPKLKSTMENIVDWGVPLVCDVSVSNNHWGELS